MTQDDTQRASIGILSADTVTAVLRGATTGIAAGIDLSGTASTLLAAHVAAADPHVQYQRESEKGVASGYAGLNAVSRTTVGIDATDYTIIDDATKGYVFKDDNTPAHYWNIQVTSVGAVITTDLGAAKP